MTMTTNTVVQAIMEVIFCFIEFLMALGEVFENVAAFYIQVFQDFEILKKVVAVLNPLATLGKAIIAIAIMSLIGLAMSGLVMGALNILGIICKIMLKVCNKFNTDKIDTFASVLNKIVSFINNHNKEFKEFFKGIIEETEKYHEDFHEKHKERYPCEIKLKTLKTLK